MVCCGLFQFVVVWLGVWLCWGFVWVCLPGLFICFLCLKNKCIYSRKKHLIRVEFFESVTVTQML